MHELINKIDGKIIVGQVKFDGIMYYIRIDRNIYTEENGQYNIVQDKELLQKILEYISPTSMDVKIKN